MYVSSGQINLQIPYETAGRQPDLDVVITHNGLSTQLKVSGGTASPGVWPSLFKASGIWDSLASPARPGDVVTIFATGTGVTNPASVTGTAVALSNVMPVLPVWVTVGGINAPVVYEGPSTGAIGQLQLSFRVPAGLPPGTQSIVVFVNGIPSQQGVAVNVSP
jgi:uncharacterized protein (TIGR03437 family)